MNDNPLIEAFCEEAIDFIDSINDSLATLESDPNDKSSLENCYVKYHALKGNAGFLGYKQLKIICEKCEDDFYDFKENNNSLEPKDILYFKKVTNEISRIINYIANNRSEGDISSEEILKRSSD